MASKVAPRYAEDQPAGFQNRVSKVALVGAGGQLGTYFTTALLATGKHTVTAITRADSTSALPPGVTKIAVDYDSHESLAAALKGHDALVITLAVFAPEGTHGKLVRAAAAAEIPFVVPNVYGPDPMNEAVTRDLPFWQQGQALIREIQELGMQSVVLSCGFWHEFSLGGTSMRYGFDFKKNEVVFVDRGVSKITGSTFPQCGRGLAALLSLPVLPLNAADQRPTLSRFANGCAYIDSFHVSQQDMFESVKRVTGTADADWAVSHETAADRMVAAQALMARGDRRGFGMAMYTRIMDSRGDGDASAKSDNALLGLPREDLDEWTKAAIEIGKRRAD